MEGDLTCEKVTSGFIINREGKYGSSTFFLLKNKEELEKITTELFKLLRKEDNR